NVHTVPSVASVSHWLTEAGFKQVRLLDLSPTTVEEQRATPWMHFESLRDYLDPRDPSRTVEGYPAPLRAMLHASIP
ncbi:MAG: DUF1698 domain-containing protein, partial [Chromatiales bacterium]|nr:DUF1698 domain-containing protein [Chromatiales bacterium]